MKAGHRCMHKTQEYDHLQLSMKLVPEFISVQQEIQRVSDFFPTYCPSATTL
jgi:hypothetical protein